MKLFKKKLTYSLNQTKVESSDKSSHKISNSNNKTPVTSVHTAKKQTQIKNNQNISVTNTSHKKFSKNIPLVNIKKQIFSSSVVTPGASSPSANSKIKKKPPIVAKKISSKNSFSIGNTNNESNLYSLSTTARKKNSSSDTRNANPPVSKFNLGKSTKSKGSDDCTKYIELMNKIKGLCSLKGTDDFFLLKDFNINIKSPSKKEKKLSRNNSDHLYTPNKQRKLSQDKIKMEMIFSQIENILKSANKAKQESFNQNKENINYENRYNPNGKIKLESDSRILFYKKLFSICSDKLSEISDLILNTYDDPYCSPAKKENVIEKSNGKSQQNHNLESMSIESILNEGTTTARLPCSKIVSVNLPKELKEDYKTNESEKTKVDKMYEIDYSLVKERLQRNRINQPEQQVGNKGKNCNIF
jgi:hypothetical protein